MVIPYGFRSDMPYFCDKGISYVEFDILGISITLYFCQWKKTVLVELPKLLKAIELSVVVYFVYKNAQ